MGNEEDAEGQRLDADQESDLRKVRAKYEKLKRERREKEAKWQEMDQGQKGQ